MNRLGYEKALKRMGRCAEALQRLKVASDGTAQQEAWSDFITQFKSVKEIARQSAAGDPAASAYVEARHLEFSRDPLLNYIIEARNVEDHAVESSFEETSWAYFGPGAMTAVVRRRPGPKPKFMIRMAGTPRVLSISLSDVKARNGQMVPVPCTHLGVALKSSDPATIADLGYKYLSLFVHGLQDFIARR